MIVGRIARIAATLLAVGLWGCLAPAPALAAPDDNFRWTVRPSDAKGANGRSQFSYDLASGRQVDDYVAIKNLASQPLTFTVYATDAFTSADGAFALPPASQAARAAGTWLTLQRKNYALRPGQQLIVPFRISVPKDATPGDHAAGIIASVTTPQTDANGQQVNVDKRVAARVYLRVDGPLNPAAEIEAVQVEYDNPVTPLGQGAMTLTYQVRNTGNVRLAGKVRSHATGLLGIPLGENEELNLPELLPGAQVTLTERIDGVFSTGLVTGAVEINAVAGDGSLPVLTRTRSVWAVPWSLGYLLLLIGIMLAGVRWRRRGSMPGREQGTPALQLGDEAA